MSKAPSPRTDALRAMREARFEQLAAQATRVKKAELEAATKEASARSDAAGTKRKAKRKAR